MIQAETSRVSSRPVTYDALIVDAKLRQSLVALRSLGSRGKQVAALESTNILQASTPGFSSRWCAHAYKAPAYFPEAKPFLSYLKQILIYTGTRVVITSSDGTLALLRQHRRELEKYTKLAFAGEEALEVACNKEKTLQIAESLGVAIPRGVVVREVQEVAMAVREIGLPAVVKPVETWCWEAGNQRDGRLICGLVTTEAEAKSVVEKLTRYGGSVLFQQYLSGRREAVSLLYAQGRVYARFAQWARRTQPPLGGTSVLRQSIALPEDITWQAERLVREIELEGYAEVEFRRDAMGKAYLMEINPRLSASVEVAVRAGVDFPYLLYQWAKGEKMEKIEHYRIGGWMRYLEGDIVTVAQMMKQRGRPGIPEFPQALIEFVSDFFRPCGYDYLDWRDPKPAWTAAQIFAKRACSRIQSKIAARRMW